MLFAQLGSENTLCLARSSQWRIRILKTQKATPTFVSSLILLQLKHVRTYSNAIDKTINKPFYY